MVLRPLIFYNRFNYLGDGIVDIQILQLSEDMLRSCGTYVGHRLVRSKLRSDEVVRCRVEQASEQISHGKPAFPGRICGERVVGDQSVAVFVSYLFQNVLSASWFVLQFLLRALLTRSTFGPTPLACLRSGSYSFLDILDSQSSSTVRMLCSENVRFDGNFGICDILTGLCCRITFWPHPDNASERRLVGIASSSLMATQPLLISFKFLRLSVITWMT